MSFTRISFSRFIIESGIRSNFGAPSDAMLIYIIKNDTGDMVCTFFDGELYVDGAIVAREHGSDVLFGILPGGMIVYQASPELPVMICASKEDIPGSIVSIEKDRLFYLKDKQLITIDATSLK